MDMNNVYTLKTTKFEKFHTNKQMQEILNEALNQARAYATSLQEELQKKSAVKVNIVLHAFLVVGSSWILTKSENFNV
jgi:Putative transmembrane protein precursor